MTNLRREAKNRDCQIRIPGVCNGDNATTVLCHLSGGGMGRKQDDLFGAWGCSACHDTVDGRRYTNYKKQLLKNWHYEGVFRTQEILKAEGLISV